MQKYTDVVISQDGAALEGITVTVKTYPGAVTATIYSDDGITPATNPLTTDANGRFSFYAADGHYSLVVSGTSVNGTTITTYTIDDILLEDPSDENAITCTTLSGTDTTDATSSTEAAIKTAGGLAVAKKLFVGTLLDLSTNTAGQIKFPATQNPSADSNTLDDYEEGTFTPVVKDAATGNEATAGTAIGYYIKVGKLVTFTITIVNITTAGLTGTNQVYITGLPFNSIASFAYSYHVYAASTTSTTGSISALIDPGTSYLTLVNNTTTGVSVLPVSGLTSGAADLRITGHYYA